MIYPKSPKAPKYISHDEAPTRDLYLPRVIESTPCTKHSAEKGEPCFRFEAAENDSVHTGICNSRAIRAGMNGRIHPMSLSSTRTFRG
jgi:hypothetical protein